MLALITATLTGGSFVFLAAILLFLFGAIVALYTNVGSGMSHHPYRHVHGGAPGADLPCEDYSGSDRTFVAEQRARARWAGTRS
jgi:hypothetical protein